MPLYVLDTDHFSLFERGHPLLGARLSQLSNPEFGITVITAEELMRGRLARIRAAKTEAKTMDAYNWLEVTVRSIKDMNLFSYDERASQLYNSFRLHRLRVGTQDLRIAASTLAVGGVLLTRNRRDFEQISNLSHQDWTT